MKDLREKIRDLREDRDLKQKVVAAHLDISQQTYSNYERGRRDIPTWAVVALANYYQVSTDYLLGTDSGYLGSTNPEDYFVEDKTMRDVMYDIQKLQGDGREELVKYIRYLQSDEK